MDLCSFLDSTPDGAGSERGLCLFLSGVNDRRIIILKIQKCAPGMFGHGSESSSISV